MTTQENTVLLTEISMKLDKIIKLLEHDPSVKNDVEICFKAANEKASDMFIQDRQKEIFDSLDRNK